MWGATFYCSTGHDPSITQIFRVKALDLVGFGPIHITSLVSVGGIRWETYPNGAIGIYGANVASLGLRLLYFPNAYALCTGRKRAVMGV